MIVYLSRLLSTEEITCYSRPDLFVQMVIMNDSIAMMAL